MDAKSITITKDDFSEALATAIHELTNEEKLKDINVAILMLGVLIGDKIEKKLFKEESEEK